MKAKEMPPNECFWWAAEMAQVELGRDSECFLCKKIKPYCCPCRVALNPLTVKVAPTVFVGLLNNPCCVLLCRECFDQADIVERPTQDRYALLRIGPTTVDYFMVRLNAKIKVTRLAQSDPGTKKIPPGGTSTLVTVQPMTEQHATTGPTLDILIAALHTVYHFLAPEVDLLLAQAAQKFPQILRKYAARCFVRPMDKWVRSKTVERLRDLGYEVQTKVLDETAKSTALREKVLEEAFELCEAKTPEQVIEEMADLLSIMGAYAQNQSISWGAVLERQQTKKEQNGSFQEGTYLVSYTRKPFCRGQWVCLIEEPWMKKLSEKDRTHMLRPGKIKSLTETKEGRAIVIVHEDGTRATWDDLTLQPCDAPRNSTPIEKGPSHDRTKEK